MDRKNETNNERNAGYRVLSGPALDRAMSGDWTPRRPVDTAAIEALAHTPTNHEEDIATADELSNRAAHMKQVESWLSTTSSQTETTQNGKPRRMHVGSGLGRHYNRRNSRRGYY